MGSSNTDDQLPSAMRELLASRIAGAEEDDSLLPRDPKLCGVIIKAASVKLLKVCDTLFPCREIANQRIFTAHLAGRSGKRSFLHAVQDVGSQLRPAADTIRDRASP